MAKKLAEIDPAIVEVLTKMCSYVGVTPSDELFADSEWYENYQWTKAEEEEFKNWFIDQARRSSKIRKGVFGRSRMTINEIKAGVNWFLLNYSWKWRENNEVR